MRAHTSSTHETLGKRQHGRWRGEAELRLVMVNVGGQCQLLPEGKARHVWVVGLVVADTFKQNRKEIKRGREGQQMIWMALPRKKIGCALCRKPQLLAARACTRTCTELRNSSLTSPTKFSPKYPRITPDKSHRVVCCLLVLWVACCGAHQKSPSLM